MPPANLLKQLLVQRLHPGELNTRSVRLAEWKVLGMSLEMKSPIMTKTHNKSLKYVPALSGLHRTR